MTLASTPRHQEPGSPPRTNSESLLSGEAADAAAALLRPDQLLQTYFADRWNLLDATNYTMAIFVIVVELNARADMNGAVELLGNGREPEVEFDRRRFFSEFVSFWRPAYLSGFAYTLLGVNAVITWTKSLKYLTEFPHLSMLSLTLQHAFFPVRCSPRAGRRCHFDREKLTAMAARSCCRSLSNEGNGSQWQPMAANGSQWQPMTANGSQ
jgi:hypothetical protein